MNHRRLRLDGRPTTIQNFSQPMNGYSRKDYIFMINGRRYDLSKWFGYNGNFKYNYLH